MPNVIDKVKGIKTKNRLKFVALVLAIVMIGVGVLYSLLLLYGLVVSAVNQSYAKSFDPIGSSYVATLQDDGYYSFKLKGEEDEHFTIMQLTDIHIGGGYASAIRDRLAIRTIYRLALYNRPDFIVVTGDMAYAIHGYPGTSDNSRAIKMVINILESMQIPYMVTFGNHDAESFNYYTRSELAGMFEDEKLKYSLFQRQTGGGEDVFGEGNCVVRLLNKDNTINNGFIFIDSNDYVESGLNILGGYDVIHDDQIEWYKTEVEKLSGAPSLAFFHIPLPEHEIAWQLYENESEEVKYNFGTFGDSSVCYGYKNTGLFDLMVELGSTKGIFCGHDHTNTYSITYKGIMLTYGMSIDRLAYPTIAFTDWQRGATVINIHNDGSFNVKQTPYATAVERLRK